MGGAVPPCAVVSSEHSCQLHHKGWTPSWASPVKLLHSLLHFYSICTVSCSKTHFELPELELEMFSSEAKNPPFFLPRSDLGRPCCDSVVRVPGVSKACTALGGPFKPCCPSASPLSLESISYVEHRVSSIFSFCWNNLAFSNSSPIKTEPCMLQLIILWEHPDHLWSELFFSS